jgi:hypothetical protein
MSPQITPIPGRRIAVVYQRLNRTSPRLHYEYTTLTRDGIELNHHRAPGSIEHDLSGRPVPTLR